MTSILVHLIVGARPNFMKAAPLYRQLSCAQWCEVELVHTGQHYDPIMSEAFFTDLGLPVPNHHLGVGSASHACQTAAIMQSYDSICEVRQPDWVVVMGDVNSTMACTLVAKKRLIPVAHLEAGLRSGDRTMPEEINRIVTDVLSDLLWTPSEDADQHLVAEGIPAERIERVGNIMIDSLELLRPRIETAGMPTRLGLESGSYGVVTLHRPANVDDPAVLSGLVEQLVTATGECPLVFPVHPRTATRLAEFGLRDRLEKVADMYCIDPLGYIDFMSMVFGSRLVITDSGGLQEETTYLHIPCLTLRPCTERPVTVRLGTNRLLAPDELSQGVGEVLSGNWRRGEIPPLWDGHTARRVAESLERQAIGLL